MRRTARAVAVALATLVACGGSQVKEHDHDIDLAKVTPATLEALRPRDGEPHAMTMRIYADPGVRALPRWKEEITEQVDYASQLLTPLLGVRLSIESFKDWARAGDPARAFEQLKELDKGDGVAWVVGYIAPNDEASQVLGALGAAQPLGHHIIVDGWSETAETSAIAKTLPDIKEAEKVEVLAAHRRHKQTVILLHQLGITLGAIDESDPAWIGNPLYSPKQTGFADRTREVMTITADARVNGQDDKTTAGKLIDAIEKAEWGGWIASSKDETLAYLRAVVDAGKAGKVADDIPPVARDQVARITDLARGGDQATALAELDNLLAAYPATASLHQLRCSIMLVKPGYTDAKTKAACKRVTALAPGDPAPFLAIGEALAKSGDITAARAQLQLAASKIANLPDAKASDQAWRKLIGIYQTLGALTWTDEAIAQAKLETDPLAASVARTRARYGVPRGTPLVAPEHEGALVAAVKQALELVYASKYGEATKAIASAEKKWPGAPGLFAARCDLALRQGSSDAAKANCAKALAADPNESWALYLSGVIGLEAAATTPAGIEQLKKAITVDPDLGQAWRTLGKAYTRANNTAAFAALARDYLTKFGQSLPP